MSGLVVQSPGWAVSTLLHILDVLFYIILYIVIDIDEYSKKSSVSKCIVIEIVHL